MSDLTHASEEPERKDPSTAGKLLPLVYDELRKLAAAKLAHEKPGHTLQATALVHEAFVRLLGTGQYPHWDSRGHFFAAAAEAMRRILIDNARRKQRIKHGGGQTRIEFSDIAYVSRLPTNDLLALDEALNKLAAEDPLKAKLVELRFFVGMSQEQAAEVLGISTVTAKRYWRYARAWLHREIGDVEENIGSKPSSLPNS